MATSANPPAGAMPLGDSDPFSTPHLDRNRFSGLHQQSLFSQGSPSQAKRALEAHISETERRLQEASRLGTVLVKQRQELAERLRDIEAQQKDDEIEPELRQKLAELEREVQDVSRETARAFVGKSRIVSEVADGTVFSSDAYNSPTKVQAPSRKQRNQPSTRSNDLKLATEISSTLVQQIRDLQAALIERDEAFKSVDAERSQLEEDVETLKQRLRALDESEQRCKDRNWALETQLQELMTAQKEATDREERLSHNFNTAKTEKAALERDFEELKLTHGKFSEEQTVVNKHQEAEISSLKRNITASESERGNLQRRIDQLESQNKDLAQAFAYRSRLDERAAAQDLDLDDDDAENDHETPDNSPPGSPSKATPRHGALETETLRSSYNHALRTIQNLKSNVHREKTEKFELRRLLQETRDELEARRTNGGVDSASKKRAKAAQNDLFKKPTRPDRLGAPRSGRNEVILDDPDWEDHDGQTTPSRSPLLMPVDGRPNGAGSAFNLSRSNDNTDAYVTATENSDAFETANEAGADNTETEAFHTGAETLDGDSGDDLTETEDGGPSKVAAGKRPAPTARYSFQSTASTSGDDADDYTRTPIQAQNARYKLRVGRGSFRRGTSRTNSGPSGADFREPELRSSPAPSITSSVGTPQAGQSLFAELGNLSDPETEDGTPKSIGAPSRRGSPEVIRRMPSQLSKSTSIDAPVMVSTGMMTEPWEPGHKGAGLSTVLGAAAAGALSWAGISEAADAKAGADARHIEEPAPAPVVEKSLPSLEVSKTFSQDILPLEAAAPPSLSVSHVACQHVEPVEKEAQLLPELQSAAIVSHHVEPVEHHIPAPVIVEKEAEPLPELQFGNVVSHHIEPVEHQVPAPLPVEKEAEPLPELQFANVVSHHVEPVEHQLPSPVPLQVSTIQSQVVEPVEYTPPPAPVPIVVPVPVAEAPEPKPAEIQLSLSAIRVLESEPINAPIPPVLIPESPSSANDSPVSVIAVGSSLPPKSDQSKSGRLLGNMFRRNKSVDIVEDETSQAPRQIDETSQAAHSESGRTPFQPINGNAQTNGVQWPPRVDSRALGTQTTLSAQDIDKLLHARPSSPPDALAGQFSSPASIIGPNGPVKAGQLSPRRSREFVVPSDVRGPRRPGSSGSIKARLASPAPPLPAEAKQVIAAAAQKTPIHAPAPSPGTMGPPMMPASAYRASQAFRPRTPVQASPGASKPGSMRPMHSNPRGTMTPQSRRSSVSSFATELDYRFNIRSSDPTLDPNNVSDPRMIQAITQTMMGEYLWKYTRKTVGSDLSSTRHKRFFWVHPYTRTIYWSDQDPATASREALKAKSLNIEAVRVVTDDNPFPPGLHRKSLVIVTPSRSLKITAPTSQRHETWFNALSYLLLKNDGEEGGSGAEPTEDIEEFNPAHSRTASRMTGRSRASMGSYVSRATVRTVSPSRQQTITQRRMNDQLKAQRPQSMQPQSSLSGRLSSLSGVFRSSSSIRESMSSRQGQRSELGEGVDETRDSAEDLRKVIEAQEREAARLENVRACCDGKHDVGSLSRANRHSHSHTHSHARHSLSASRSHSRMSGNYPSPSTQRHYEMDPANVVH
ncbi:hypothetical protein EJ06DRAFT_556374 [Trichodelitschia bisporula]|uniref:PH domain-containing protein n=1 Tax=Trichodelitschia bisporula TaxID=703511 RepID=A0A6G1HYR9_9PEZI|nr:hypothetical protein EJ06DRAFT_556374 [Trichodelitschia bisporula]